MYSRNLLTSLLFYGIRQSLRSSRRIRLRSNPLGIANVSAYPKIIKFNPVTDGYTKPSGAM